MENKPKGIYNKLLEIQKRVMGLGKDKRSNAYEYVTGSKVLEHIKPLMNEFSLILKQEVLSIDNVRQDYKTGIGTQYEKPKSEILSKVMMRFTWIDCESGEKDENLFGANGQNDWEKGLGSSLTYAERYFLLKFFHIATDEDDIDNPDRQPQEQAPAPKQATTTGRDNPEIPGHIVKQLESVTSRTELEKAWTDNPGWHKVDKFLKAFEVIAKKYPKPQTV